MNKKQRANSPKLSAGGIKKLTISLATVILTWSLLTIACSARKAPINVDAEGITLKGYDTVAYFTEGRPVKGTIEFQHEWQGAKWLFASQEHLDMFRENPEKYAPQYGGY